MKKVSLYFIVLFNVFTIGCSKSDDEGNDINNPPVQQLDSTFLRQYIEYDISGVNIVFTQSFEYDANFRVKSIFFWQKVSGLSNPLITQFRDTTIFSYSGNSENPSGIIHRKAQLDNANNLLEYSVFNRKIGYTLDGKVANDTSLSTYTYSPFSSSSSRRFVYESSTTIKEYRKSGSSSESELIHTLTYLPSNRIEQYSNGVKTVEAILDDKRHPYYKIRPISGFFDFNYPYFTELCVFTVSPRNLLGLKIYSLSSPSLLFSADNTYTYRSDGYPLTVNKTYTAGPSQPASGKFIYY